MMKMKDQNAIADQRLMWDDLRKSINGLVNRVTESNIKEIAEELVSKNLIWGRGLFCRAILKSSVSFSNLVPVFAALVAAVNSKFPDVGYLLLKRILFQAKISYKHNDKVQLPPLSKLLAHLINQFVAHEIVALELLFVLLQEHIPSKEIIEIAVSFITDCGSALYECSPRGLHSIFERFREILDEGHLDYRSKCLIEGLFAIRKSGFSGYPAVLPELDIVELDDQVTHEISYYNDVDPEMSLDIFEPDSNLISNDEQYNLLQKIVQVEEEEDQQKKTLIQDQNKVDLRNLRKTVFLTIVSSVNFEEAGHKLLRIPLGHGQEMELCNMLLECCSLQQTYFRYYALLAQRLCLLNKVYSNHFEQFFTTKYSGIHCLETYKICNFAKFFAHLLSRNALTWNVMAYISLSEEDTNTSSLIFIKILFQELAEQLGIGLLYKRLNEPSIKDSVASIFPKDNSRNIKFSINFFTSIGLGDLTKNLRDYLKQNKTFDHSDDGYDVAQRLFLNSSEDKPNQEVPLDRKGKRRKTDIR